MTILFDERYFLLLFLVLGTTACTEDINYSPEAGPLLAKVEVFSSDGAPEITTFQYDEYDRPVKRVKEAYDGLTTSEVTYENNLAVLIHHSNESGLEIENSVDSLFYDNRFRLNRIAKYNENEGGQLDLVKDTKFSYDEDDQVVKIKLISTEGSQTSTYLTELAWEDGNVTTSLSYNEADDSSDPREFVYLYDEGVNPYLGTGVFNQDFGKNYLTSVEWKNIPGNICLWPCFTQKVFYHKNKYPRSVRTSCGEINFSYTDRTYQYPVN